MLRRRKKTQSEMRILAKGELGEKSPILVKVMFFGGGVTDPAGHIGVKAWVPGTPHRYSIHFVKGSASMAHWANHLDAKDAANDADWCKESFVFLSIRTLKELRDWHEASPFYKKSDWTYKHNCADAMQALFEDFFQLDLTQQASCISAPFSSCFWKTSRITMPRVIFDTAKKMLAVDTSKSRLSASDLSYRHRS